MKRTKIVCTIGPASEKKETIRQMIKAGMDVARLNFSHGTYDYHNQLIKNIREVSLELKKPVAILADLQGPKVRVANLPKEGINLEEGEDVVVTVEEKNLPKNYIPTGYKNLYKDVKTGDTILLDDGLLELEVSRVAKESKNIYCRVKVGGILTSHKGINVPTASLSIPPVTPKDRKDLVFALAHDVEYVALSFVKTAKDIINLRKTIELYDKKKKGWGDFSWTKIIAKIEKHEAIRNIDEILDAADGAMVARGDLGIETSMERVPLCQKMIIEKCLSLAKPVITATQMLASMERNPRPTRAEVSDVANAVIDHTSAIMLSGESATGRYPVLAVQTMSQIVSSTEESPYDDLMWRDILTKEVPLKTALCGVGCRLAKNVAAKAIIVTTLSGETAKIVSSYRPESPVVAIVENDRIKKQLALEWGIHPFVLPLFQTVDELIVESVRVARDNKLVNKGDKVVIIGGQPVGSTGNINLIKVHTVS